jgi:hypothetical protein
MHPISRQLVWGLAGTLLAILSPSASAQGKKDSETVRFETVDQVELKGTYWPSSKGKKGPVALLLPKIGGSHNEEGWKALAEELQKAGFAVLAFDYRGHGGSKNVGTNFWKYPTNASGIRYTARAGKMPDTIELSQFKNGYLPHLVDDISAAKSFLERRYNDEGACNLSNLVLIGAEDGATLGALWLATECKRYRVQFNRKSDKPESKDVIACVWLNMSGYIGSGRQATNVVRLLPSWLLEAGGLRGQKIPMLFYYGKDDKQADAYALGLVKGIRRKYDRATAAKATPDDELYGTLDAGVPGTDLKGAKLLTGSLGAREQIVKKYLEKFILDSKKGLNEWEKRESDTTFYVWELPTRRTIPAIMLGEKNLYPIPLSQLGVGVR